MTPRHTTSHTIARSCSCAHECAAVLLKEPDTSSTSENWCAINPAHNHTRSAALLRTRDAVRGSGDEKDRRLGFSERVVGYLPLYT